MIFAHVAETRIPIVLSPEECHWAQVQVGYYTPGENKAWLVAISYQHNRYLASYNPVTGDIVIDLQPGEKFPSN
jgi:hypothetical protein